MNLFFGIVSNDGLAWLPEEESAHCIRVLRMTGGQEIHFTDGGGSRYAGTILKADPKRCTIRISEIQKDYRKRNYFLHIAIAPTKSMDRFEWFLEKATEIGVDEITPLLCRHSERKSVKSERLKKVILAAMKQSNQAFLPKLNEMLSFEQLINGDKTDQRFICTADAEKGLQHMVLRKKPVLLLIGPEGDFAEREIRSAQGSHFQAAQLGPNRLRTETAGVVACSVVSLLNQK